MSRALLGGAIAVLLIAGVTAAVVVDPSDEEKGSSSSPTTVPPSGGTAAPAPPASGTSLSRAEASRALCAELDASIRTVAEGQGIAGGLRLSRALNTYETTADPSVVEPSQRMLTTAARGQLERTSVAAGEAASACARLGHPFQTAGGGPCDPGPCEE